MTKLFNWVKFKVARYRWNKKKLETGRVVKMSEVAFICQPKDKHYTKEEVLELLPILNTICVKYNSKRQKIFDNQCYYVKTGAPQTIVTECDNKIGAVMQECFTKIYKLGGKALGGGWVAFDNGTGYWIWRYSEPQLLWVIGYGCDPALFRRPA